MHSRSFIVVGLLACGGGAHSTADSGTPDSGSPDAGSLDDAGTADAGWVEADHPSLPITVSKGGPVIANPKVIPITFANDPLVGNIETMVAALANTSAYADELKEWGSGKPMPQPPIRDPEVFGAMLHDTAIQALIKTRLAPDAGSAWPAPDADTVYMLFFPPGTTIIEDAGLGTSCVDFHGYHLSTVLDDGTKVSYVVVSRCDSLPELPGVTGIGYAAAVMSHEMMEAITDPLPLTHPAYDTQDKDHIVWSFMLEGELADMCALVGDAFYTPTDFPYLVQRLWSNVSMLGGHDPCIPQPAGEPYFNTVPVLDDDITLTYYGASYPTKGVKIPVGQSKDVELDLFSDGPTSAPWGVFVGQTSSAAHLKLTLDQPTGQNGDKLHVNIQVLSVDPTYGGEVFVIESKLGTRTNLYFGAVGN